MDFEGTLRTEIALAYTRAAKAEGWPGEIPLFAIDHPKDHAMGDYACNIALQLARPLRRAPREIAERLAAALELPEDFLTPEVAGQGFINFRLSRAFYGRLATTLLADPGAYLSPDIGHGERILLEYVSANPTGPLNLVSARAAAIGDTLGRLLRRTGHDVYTEFYVNDAGRQVENLALSILARMEELMGREAELPEDGYKGAYVIDMAQGFLEVKPQGFDALDAAQRMAAVRDWALREVSQMRRRTLEAFSVHFDNFFSEAQFRATGEVERTIAMLEQGGHTYRADGALWLRTTEFGDDKDRVIVKSDGEPTYFAPDIAYHHGKYLRGYTRVVDLLGPDHHGYVARMRAAMQALSHPPQSFHVTIVQWVRFLEDGELRNMSKRAGGLVTIDQLLEDVGRDAARYFFLMRSTDTPLDFDLQLAQEESSENPVYYVQYAHARISSILRQAGEVQAQPDYGLLGSPEEDAIMRRLANLPGEIADAARALEPHRLTRLAAELAQDFHGFYNRNRVLGVEPALSASRLSLIRCVQSAIREILDILGVSSPERM